MFRTGVFRLLRTTNIRSNRFISISSRSASSQNVHKSLPNIDEIFGKDCRPIQQLVDEPIIVKKFFVSEVDREQMHYPEVISKDEFEHLTHVNQNVSEHFEKICQFDDKGITKSVHEIFKKMGLYGYNIPKEFGGRGYIYTETLMVSEAEAENTNAAMTLNAHRLVCEAINEFGTDKQRSDYLPKLANGDFVGTTAFQEWNRSEMATERTIALFDTEKNQWRLNGVKSFVINSANSNLYLVTAQVPQSSKNDSLAVFLVDGNLPGVSIHTKDETIGLKKLYQSEVSFSGVYLSPDAILSAPGSGRHIERTTMFLSRIQQSLLNLTQMKIINNYMLNMVESIEQHNRVHNAEGTSFEAGALRLEISKGAANIYSIESMLYMIVGIMDLYKNTDIDVETAILKNHSQELLFSMTIGLSNFIDTPATLDEHPINQIIRDAVQLQTIGEPKDILKLYIGIAGIQHSGDRIFDEVKKKRNLFFNPEYALRLFFKEETMDRYESDLRLMENVVSEFDIVAGWLEASIHRLRIGANILMTAHGRNIYSEHQEIQRLAETVTYIFASFACLVRANRSWILKLPEGESERVLAGCSCDTNRKLVEDLMRHIEDGPMDPIDKHYQTIAKQLMKTKSYFPVHPLTRFF